MGTISEKLTYLNGTKQELKDKINNLGGSIDDNTTFRQYANQLQNVYDNLPKTEYQEGTEITLSNTLKGKLDYENGVVGIGQSSQDSTQGYQLLNITATSGTKNGATWVVNEDKSITISTNGATTGVVTIPVVTSKTLEAGTYYMSGITGGTENTYFFGILVDNPTQWVVRNYNGVTQFSVSEQKTYRQIWVVIAIGTTISTPITIYPMISKTNTSNYEQYTGGQASPSPNWEQEVKCVAGRNKFDEDVEQGAINSTAGATYPNCKTNSNTRIRSKNLISLDKSELYTISCDSNYRVVIQAFNDNQVLYTTTGTNSWVSSVTFTNIPYIAIAVKKVSEADITPQEISSAKVMLEQGSTAHPYLPYNTIEEVVSGKNLLDMSLFENNYSLDANGLPISSGSQVRIANTTPINVEGLDKITLSYTAWEGGQSFIYSLLKADNTKIARQAGNVSGTTITIGEAKYLYICFYDGATTEKVTDAMLVEGTTSAPYEPYITPTSYQLSLGDIELCKIGTYQDYIYKSGGKWYVHKEINKVIFTGASSENWQTGQFGTNSYSINVEDVIMGTGENTETYCISNLFKGTSYSARTIGDNIMYQVSGTKQLYIRNTTISSVADFKTLLGTKNLITYYVLATSTDTEITDTSLINQLEALYNAHSLNGTTIITSNGNLPMIIKVRGLKGE